MKAARFCERLRSNTESTVRRSLPGGCRLQARLAAAVFCLASAWPASAAEPAAGSQHDVQSSGAEGAVGVRFRYCPSGRLHAGPPQTTRAAKEGARAGAAAGPETTPVAPFYLSETEVTVPQFRGLLGVERTRKIAGRFPGLKTAPQALLAALNAGSEVPLSMATLADAFEFCEALRTGCRERLDGDGIAAVSFRLPTHNEWQYACRAYANPDATPAKPHFQRWPDGYDTLDKNIRGMCDEEWSQLAKGDRPFAGTQEQVAELLESRQNSGNDKPVQILSAFLKAGIGIDRSYASGGKTGTIHPVRYSHPNEWGFYEMHENVCERVLVAQGAEAAELWKGLVEASSAVRNRRVQFFAGGAYNLLMAGPQAGGWKQFTIWGGSPMDVKTGDIRPFSLDDEGAGAAITSDYEPGFRVAMTRVLADDWLLALRRDVVLADAPAPDLLTRLEKKQSLALDLASPAQKRSVASGNAYYEAIACYRLGKISQARAAFASARKDLVVEAPVTQSQKLEALLGGAADGAPASANASASLDDAAYFDALAVVLDLER